MSCFVQTPLLHSAVSIRARFLNQSETMPLGIGQKAGQRSAEAVNLLHVRDLQTIDCEAKARVAFLSRRCSHILCNAPKEKKQLATERIQKPKKPVVGPNKRQVLLGLVASSGSSGHVWKATTDKTNFCVKCERCSLWIQQNDKPDLFDRLTKVPCLDHVLEPPLHCHASHKLQF